VRSLATLRKLAAGVGLALAGLGGAASATESGASLYLLGTGGPGAAILPPIEGVFLANTLYHYSGEMGGGTQTPLGGNLVVGLTGDITADFASVLWVPTTDFGGATLAVGAILAAGVPDVTVDAVITGPLGGQVGGSRGEDKFIVGDPVVTGMVGWKRGDWHLQTAALLNIPVGDYRAGHLSNLAFHRWALDTSAAVTWKDETHGWDVSAKTGVTFNGTNTSTDYESGDEWHVEAAVEKTLSPKWSLGMQAYYLSQMSDDEGSGAVLGPFRGQVSGVGATAAYNFMIAGKIPATLRLHAMTEMAAKNRLEGDSIFLDFTMPLHVVMPPVAAP
jgi:hypothetical protein